MKFHLSPHQKDASKSLTIPHGVDLNWSMRFTAFLSILLINALRVPSGLMNFWAEDGVVFYSDVINGDFPKRLFLDSGGGGYLNLSGKIIAEGVGILPIEFAPIVNFVFVNLVYSILFVVIYNRLSLYFKTKTFLFLLMGFFVFVPIASYDSVATSINLHFFLLFASFVIIFAKEGKITVVSHLIIFITCLSDPLAILLIPAIAVLVILKRNLNSHLLTYIFSLFMQVAFIVQFFGDSTRVVGQSPSIVKTTYLFMDRVVGSSLIPNWGFVEGQILESDGIPRILIVRLVASFIVLSLLMYVLFTARPINLTQLREGQNFLVGSMLLSVGVYWSVTGLVFNPEPRYAIFPSLCLVTIFLLSIDSIVSNFEGIRARRFFLYSSSMLFISIFASAFQVSSFRDTDQVWSEQLVAGKAACKEGSLLKVEIKIPPKRNNLLLSLDCKILR